MSAKVLKHTVVVDPAEAAAAADALEAVTDEAYERGRVEGIAEGGAVLADAVRELTAELETMRAQVAADAAAMLRSDVETMVALATDLAAWFVEQSVSVDETTVVARVADCVNDLLDEDGLVVHVPAELAEPVQSALAAGVAVKADNSLGPVDFRIVTPTAVVERLWSDAVADLVPEFTSALRVADSA